MIKADRRVIKWDAKKKGSKLGQAYTYGPTYKEWVKSVGANNPTEWQKQKS